MAEIYLKLCLLVCSFILSASASYFFLRYVNRQTINAVTNAIHKKTSESYDRRIRKTEAAVKIYGNSDKSGRMVKLDTELEMSGIKRCFPFMNTELLIVFFVFVTATVLVISAVLTRSAVITAAVAGFMVYTLKLVMRMLIAHSIREIDDNLIQFSSQLDSYSNASDDIITIMDYTVPYLSEPLKGAIQTCVQESRMTGDIDTAFERVNLKIKYGQFNMLMENLLEGSKNRANYREIIERNHETITTYLMDKEDRRAKAKAGNIVIYAMIAVLVLTLYIMTEVFLQIRFKEFFFSDIVGNMLFATVVATLLVTLWISLSNGRE